MEYRLDELFDLQMGKTPARKNPEYWNSNDHKWISIADLSKCEKYITETKEHISSIAVQESGISEIPANTVIMSFKLSIGKTAITKEPIYSNEAIMSFRDKGVTPLLPDYIYYMFSGRDWSKGSNTAVMGTTLNKATLSQIRIYVHAYEDQKRIVDLLDKVSSIISKRKQELVELDDLIKARFVEMFGDPVYSAIDSKIELSDICEKITDGEHGSVARVANGHPFLNAKHILKTGVIDWKTITYIGDEDHQRIYKRCNPEKGDILLTTTGTIGNVAIMPECEEVSMDRGITLLKINRHKVTSEFVAEMLKHPSIQMAMGANVHASAIGHLFMNKVKKLPSILPSMKKQIEFTTFVQQIDKSKHHSPHLPIPPLKWYPLPKNEVPIMEEKIIAITNEMAEVLNIAQLKKLQEVLVKAFSTEEPERKPTNHEYLRLFLEAKSIEGCSPRTLQYYEVTVQHLFAAVNLPVRKMTTERMREYLSDYQQRRNCSKATIDNIRRNISSFFSWLEEEDHILKSPMRRIHKIKTKKTVKEVISDEDIEKLRDSCTTLRDLAMIDLLYSTGIRVGELVRLNIEDVNFESRECVVFGKGDKERRVYFDAKTKIHLKNYLESRRDTNRALFVSLLAPYNRLAISGVEIRLRKMGRMLNLKSIHPHKFRRTMATRAIDKGMPIEQVQKILGHSQIDTTMQYAIVNQNNVKMSHQKYIA